jgi:uncharacterized repeat protein (TIGR03803 family)
MKTKRLACAAVLACILIPASFADAQLFQTLCSFNYANGDGPRAGLTLGPDGNLYGATEYGGGGSDIGTVFQVTTNGTVNTLFSFSGSGEGSPEAAMTLGPDGDFYGTCPGGGDFYGSVFKLSTNGTITTVCSFNGADGDGPQLATLTLGPDGNFYGTTQEGGSDDDNGYGLGTVFKVTPGGRLTTLVSFNGTNGEIPWAGLTLGPDGNLYGTAAGGGNYDNGTIFQVTTNGTLTTLVSFNGTNGGDPGAALTLGLDGNLYGTTYAGGDYGAGTVFKVTTNGTLSTLASFDEADGMGPQAPVMFGPDGNLYGTTSAGSPGNSWYGTVFKLTPTGTLDTLVFFDRTNGATPMAGLTLGSDGNLYGTTVYGGSSGEGTVFRLVLPPVVHPTLTLQLSTGCPQLNLAGTLGNNYVVQYATNLANPNWVNLLSLTNLQASPFSFLDPAGVVPPARYYRAVMQ